MNLLSFWIQRSLELKFINFKKIFFSTETEKFDESPIWFDKLFDESPNFLSWLVVLCWLWKYSRKSKNQEVINHIRTLLELRNVLMFPLVIEANYA